MPIIVTNTKDYAVHPRSFDGNSTTVPGKARRVPIASKFAWQMPEGLVIVEHQGEDARDPTAFVRHYKPVQALIRAPRTAEEAKAVQRQGLHPHHTLAERRAAQQRAKQLLAKEAEKTRARGAEASPAAMQRASTMGGPGARPGTLSAPRTAEAEPSVVKPE